MKRDLTDVLSEAARYLNASASLTPKGIPEAKMHELADECSAHAAQHRALRKAKIVHRGYSYRRTECADESGRWEKAYADAWEHENDLSRATSPYLASLLSEDRKEGGFPGAFERHWIDTPLTQRDATVAATVVQWLGTNIGSGFVQGVLRSLGYAIVRTDSSRASRC